MTKMSLDNSILNPYYMNIFLCFQLVVFGFVTSCMILMFDFILFVSFLESNMFVYGGVTCWDKKSMFESKKYSFIGMEVLGSNWVFVEFQGMFFVLLERTMS